MHHLSYIGNDPSSLDLGYEEEITEGLGVRAPKPLDGTDALQDTPVELSSTLLSSSLITY